MSVERFESLSEKQLLKEIAIMMQKSNDADVISIADLLTVYLLPPAFFTGWFGMNFDNLPYVQRKNSWRILLAVCLAYMCLATAVLLYRKNPYNSLFPGGSGFGLSDRQRQRLQFGMFASSLCLALLATKVA